MPQSFSLQSATGSNSGLSLTIDLVDRFEHDDKIYAKVLSADQEVLPQGEGVLSAMEKLSQGRFDSNDGIGLVADIADERPQPTQIFMYARPEDMIQVNFGDETLYTDRRAFRDGMHQLDIIYQKGFREM